MYKNRYGAYVPVVSTIQLRITGLNQFDPVVPTEKVIKIASLMAEGY